MNNRKRHNQQCEDLLKTYDVCKNSDNELMIGMLHLNGMPTNEEQRRVIKSINFESIFRERRKFQEKGMYLPTDPMVAKKRRLKSYEIQQVAPKASPHELQQRIANNA